MRNCLSRIQYSVSQSISVEFIFAKRSVDKSVKRKMECFSKILSRQRMNRKSRSLFYRDTQFYTLSWLTGYILESVEIDVYDLPNLENFGIRNVNKFVPPSFINIILKFRSISRIILWLIMESGIHFNLVRVTL